MSHTPHTLADEFPDEQQKIHRLKTSNMHFLRLFNKYEEVNGEIHLAETNVKPTDQFHEAELRKQRLLLKDEIAAMLV
jgi:uncharacterized protein YdcH (DUF465 family)